MVIKIYTYIDRCPSNRRNCINEKRKFKLLFSTVSDTFQRQCTCKTIVLTTVPATGTRFNSSHSSPALRQPLSYILLSPVCVYQVQTKWLKKHHYESFCIEDLRLCCRACGMLITRTNIGSLLLHMNSTSTTVQSSNFGIRTSELRVVL